MHLETKAVIQTRVKFAALGRRWSRLKVISRGKNPRPTASASHSRARQLTITLRPRATYLTLAAHSLAFVSLRVSYYYINSIENSIFSTCSFLNLRYFFIEVMSQLEVGVGQLLNRSISFWKTGNDCRRQVLITIQVSIRSIGDAE